MDVETYWRERNATAKDLMRKAKERGVAPCRIFRAMHRRATSGMKKTN